MLLRCINNTLESLSAEERKATEPSLKLSQVNLTPGELYVAVGVIYRDGGPWFLVCEEKGDEYPKPHFHAFFEVIDPRIPPGWSLTTRRGNVEAFSLLPDQLALDPHIIERLVEGEPEAISAFHALCASLEDWHALVPSSTGEGER